MPIMLFAVSTDTSVGEVFIAGVGPGILLAGCLIGYVWWYARRNGLGKHDGDGRLPNGESFLRPWWSFLMPVIILDGIYVGVFTPTEARSAKHRVGKEGVSTRYIATSPYL